MRCLDDKTRARKNCFYRVPYDANTCKLFAKRADPATTLIHARRPCAPPPQLERATRSKSNSGLVRVNSDNRAGIQPASRAKGNDDK